MPCGSSEQEDRRRVVDLRRGEGRIGQTRGLSHGCTGAPGSKQDDRAPVRSGRCARLPARAHVSCQFPSHELMSQGCQMGIPPVEQATVRVMGPECIEDIDEGHARSPQRL